MARHKETTDPKQAMTLIGLVLLVSAFFGYTILPMLSPSKQRVGKTAPDFALPVIHGGEAGNRVKLSDLQGRAVLLDFWASWCVPCRQQAPIVDRIAQRYDENDVVVLGVNTGESQEVATEYAKKAGLGYTSVWDTGRVAMEYGASVLPTIVVIDRKGRILTKQSGVTGERALREMLHEALQAQ